MNKKLENSVNEILGLDPVAEDQPENAMEMVVKETPAVPRINDPKDTDIDNDYQNSRENYYNLIDKGNEAIEGILEIAKEGQHPRAYEVAGQLIKSVSDATDKLMDLQKKLKDVNKEEEAKGPSTVNNALFVGSTSELSKILKSGLNKENK